MTSECLADVTAAAARRDRRRLNHNLHPTLADPVQRLVNVLHPGSYVRPHRHTQPPRWELFVILSGRAVVLTLADDGRVEERCELGGDGGAVAVEIEAGRWHTVLAVNRPAVLFEVKPGPYSPVSDKDFAAWAPAEGQPACDRLLAWLATALPGDRPPTRAAEAQ